MEENTAPKHFEVGEIGTVSKADFAKFRWIIIGQNKCCKIKV